MKLSYDYIRGLTDGEGCFTFSTSKQRNGSINKIPAFAIAMNERDKELIEGVRDTLGLKNRVYIHKASQADGYKRGLRAFLIVREFGSLKNIIIPLFYKKLMGNKGKQFNEWLEKIGNDPKVPQSYKLLYRLHKSGFYDKNPKF